MNHDPRKAAAAAEGAWRARETMGFLLGMVEAEMLSQRIASPTSPVLHVTVIAGFLGAGKTSLLRHLLRAPHGRRLAVVVNDFATLEVDEALIRETGADTVTLTNGCVCCSASGGMARVLAALSARPAPPELVLLEASGVADPGTLAATLTMLPQVRVDSVVTVVDAHGSPAAGPVARLKACQLRAADVVLLNKSATLSKHDKDMRLRELQTLAPSALVLATEHCEVPAALLLETPLPATRAAPGGVAAAEQLFWHVEVNVPETLSRASLQRCIETLPADIARLKGFVRPADAGGEVYCLQGVGRRWSWHAIQGPVAVGRVVVIGALHGPGQAEALRHLASYGLMQC